jgi:hypothetical protein
MALLKHPFIKASTLEFTLKTPLEFQVFSRTCISLNSFEVICNIYELLTEVPLV